MSLPHYKMTMLAMTLGIASAMVGCSSNPKEVVDKGQNLANRFISKSTERARSQTIY